MRNFSPLNVLIGRHYTRQFFLQLVSQKLPESLPSVTCPEAATRNTNKIGKTAEKFDYKKLQQNNF